MTSFKTIAACLMIAMFACTEHSCVPARAASPAAATLH
jgi:hypothetical protein